MGVQRRKWTMQALMWTLSGWHRHVGTVADIFRDPDLAAFSWKEGEAAPRPRQAMIMITVAATTGTSQPKLLDDYGHLFKGLDQEEEMRAIFRTFKEELQEVHNEIQRRNEQ